MSGAAMTCRLVAGTIRAHRGYFAWTTSLMAILLAILTYIVVAGATQATLIQMVADLRGQDHERSGWALVSPRDKAEGEFTVTASELAEIIDKTPGSIARASNPIYLQPVDDHRYDDPAALSIWATTAYGNSDDAGLLIEGRMPASRGEVAVASDLARSMGLSLGESATVYTQLSLPEGLLTWNEHEITVVGISVAQRLAGYDANLPGLLTSWAEVQAGGLMNNTNLEGDRWVDDSSMVELAWDGPAPLLDPYFQYSGSYWYEEIAVTQTASAWFSVAAVLVGAMVVMSFAVGRSQAAARSKWIATVRTLGATRGYVAAATALETLAIAAFATVVGVVLGVLGAQLQLASARASSEGAFGPAVVTLHWAILPVAVVVALLVALLISAVPAFWASRVQPVAALKPVSDITEAELSRRVAAWWLWIPFVGGIALMLASNKQPNAETDALTAFGAVLTIISVIALTIEAVRWAVPRIGGLFARSRRASRITAGDALSYRSRQAVAPGLLAAIAVGTFVAMTFNRVSEAGSGFQFRTYADFGYDQVATIQWWWSLMASPSTVVVVVLGAVVIELVAASMYVAHRAATARETATRSALGMSAADVSRSQWWQQWIPQCVGAGAGVIAGSGVVGLWHVMNTLLSSPGWTVPSALYGLAAVAVTGAVVVLLALAAITAWVVTRVGRGRSSLVHLTEAA